MATSTEATVRAVIAGAIQGVASTLGFESSIGNVHEYLLEWENDERKAEYLMARLTDGSKQVRAWGVQVLGNDDWVASNNITQRRYQILIIGYYSKGVQGEGINALIDGARTIRGAIRSLGSRLTETVDLVSSTGQITPRELGRVDPVGSVIEGTMEYVAERRNPDF